MYYVYNKGGGDIDVSDHELLLELFPGYSLIEVTETPPSNHFTKWIDGEYVQTLPQPKYVYDRKAAYPSYGDQLDMLWHAMDDGVIPKVEPMYSQIKAVKEQYPKPDQLLTS